MAVLFTHSNHTRIPRRTRESQTQIDYVQNTYLRLKSKCVLLFSVPFAGNVLPSPMRQTSSGTGARRRGRYMEDATWIPVELQYDFKKFVT